MTNNLPSEEIEWYDPETATEGERFAFDCGWEDGYNARLDPTGINWGNLAEVREVIQALVAGLDVAIARKRTEAGR